MVYVAGSAVEQELSSGQNGPEQVFERLAARHGLILCGVRQQILELSHLHRRRFSAKGEKEEPARGFFVTNLLVQPARDEGILRAQLVVERLPVIQVQRLSNTGILLSFAGARLRTLGSAESFEEGRSDLH